MGDEGKVRGGGIGGRRGRRGREGGREGGRGEREEWKVKGCLQQFPCTQGSKRRSYHSR